MSAPQTYRMEISSHGSKELLVAFIEYTITEMGIVWWNFDLDSAPYGVSCKLECYECDRLETVASKYLVRLDLKLE